MARCKTQGREGARGASPPRPLFSACGFRWRQALSSPDCQEPRTCKAACSSMRAPTCRPQVFSQSSRAEPLLQNIPLCCALPWQARRNPPSQSLSAERLRLFEEKQVLVVFCRLKQVRAIKWSEALELRGKFRCVSLLKRVLPLISRVFHYLALCRFVVARSAQFFVHPVIRLKFAGNDVGKHQILLPEIDAHVPEARRNQEAVALFRCEEPCL